jgi:hypothetical protein
MYLQNKVFTYPFLAVHLFHPQLTTGIRVSNTIVLLIHITTGPAILIL